MIVDPNEIVKVVQVTRAVMAVQRFLESDLTSFFAETDFWSYEISGDNTCTLCTSFSNQIFSGDMLQSTFQYLQIVDSMTINALVHPNCVCQLKRVVKVGEKFYHVHPSPSDVRSPVVEVKEFVE